MKKIISIYNGLINNYRMVFAIKGTTYLVLKLMTLCSCILMVASWFSFSAICICQFFTDKLDTACEIAGWCLIFFTPVFMASWFVMFMYDCVQEMKRRREEEMNIISE